MLHNDGTSPGVAEACITPRARPATGAWPALRVLFVGPAVPPAGGMAVLTEQLIAHVRAEGAPVSFVANNPPYAPAWVGSLRGVRAVARLAPYFARLWHASSRADVMHVMANSGWAWFLFAVPALWAARLRGARIVVNYHGGEADAFLRRFGALFRLSLPATACVVVPSGYLQQVFRAHGVASTIVPNLIDLAPFRDAPPQSRPETPHLIVARNLERVYDVATAIRAFARVRSAMPGATLTVAGSGPERDHLVELAASLQLADAVTFAGRLDRAGIAHLYRSASLLLNPSLADNMPVSLLEAMAARVPIVSTNVGGIPFLMRDGVTGLLVPAGDDGAMAGAALRILQQAEFAGQLVAQAERDVQQYAWHNVGAAWREVYVQAVA